jgi:hypothetical protein
MSVHRLQSYVELVWLLLLHSLEGAGPNQEEDEA